MRFLIVSCVYPPEPVVSSQTSADVAEGLNQRGHAVTVVAPFPNRPGGRLYPGFSRRLIKRQQIREGFELVRCFSFLSRSSRLISRLMENLSFGLVAGWVVLTAARPDLIYANTWPIMATGLLSVIARVRRIPLVISVQDLYPESLISQGRISENHPLSRLIRWIDSTIARGCQGVIVISESFAERYRNERGLDPRRLQVIPNWAHSELLTPNDDKAPNFRAAKNVPQDAFVILYGGNVGAAAGVDTIIRAFSQLQDAENLYLIIAGEGSSIPSCRELAQQLSCQRVLFHSPWAKDETSMTLASADLLILPTRGLQSMASVPSKLISYMLAARAVIASALPHSELAEMIESSQVGWVVEPDRPELLADLIRAAMTMEKVELQRKGQLGRAYALEKLTREVCLPRVIDLLENGGS